MYLLYEKPFLLKMYLKFLTFIIINISLLVYCQKEQPYLKGRYSRSIDRKYSIIVPKRVDESGALLSHNLPNFYLLHRDYGRRKRETERGTVHYVVPLDGIDHHLELHPNMEFMSPGLVIEEHAANARGNMSGIKFSQVRPYQCHYYGSVRGVPGSKVAASLCHGMAAIIKTPDNEYQIEPASKEQEYGEEGEQLHLLFKRSDEENNSQTNCGTKGKWADAWLERMEWEDIHGKTIENSVKGYLDNPLPAIVSNKKYSKRNKGSCCTEESKTVCAPTEPVCTLVSELFLELMLAVDRKIIQQFVDEDKEIFLLTIVNMVTINFFDSSLGRPIHIKLVRLIYINTDYPELDVARYSPQKLLLNFCNWQMEFNPRKEEHPNHHDFALFITRFEPCQGRGMGVTNMASLCRPDKACAVVSEEGLLLANIITHQLGHSLGAEHDDGESGGCAPEEPDGTKYHMGPIISLSSSEWSTCSKDCISQFITTHASWCLSDIPTDHDFHSPLILPGQVYIAADQCTINYHMKTYPCRVGQICKTLYCQISATACATTGDPPAPGTSCAFGMWCFNKQCIHRGLRPGSINGEWGEWSPWSTCTRSCGGGVQSSHRSCNNPLPSRGGRNCVGNWIRHKMCATQQCLGYSQTFADVQCKMTDSRPYRGRHYSWSQFHSFFRGFGCTLICINEKGVVAVRSSVALDGTPCFPSARDVCIEGECKVVGCDWVIDSKAKEDMCGICHGNGTACRVIQGEFTDSNIKGLVTFLKLPIGTSMIFISEHDPSNCLLSISNSINSTFYLNRQVSEQLPGSLSIAGAVGVYETKAEMERLFIRSPIEAPIAINLFCENDSNKGISYQYALPELESRMPSYRWEFLDWDICTDACGGGTQTTYPSCVEERSGEVEDKYCQESLRPAVEVRVCNNFPCITKWWVGPWSDCDCTDGQGIMTRTVICIRSKDAANLRTEVVSEKECCDQPKPRLEKPCNATKELELIESKYPRERREKHFELVPYDADVENEDEFYIDEDGVDWYSDSDYNSMDGVMQENQNYEMVKRDISRNSNFDKAPGEVNKNLKNGAYNLSLTSLNNQNEQVTSAPLSKSIRSNNAGSDRLGDLNALLKSEKHKTKVGEEQQIKAVKNALTSGDRRFYSAEPYVQQSKEFIRPSVKVNRHPLGGIENESRRKQNSNERGESTLRGNKYQNRMQNTPESKVREQPVTHNYLQKTASVGGAFMASGLRGKSVTTVSPSSKEGGTVKETEAAKGAGGGRDSDASKEGNSTTPFCVHSLIDSILTLVNGSTCSPTVEAEDEHDVPPFNLPSRVETNWTLDKLDIVPIESTRLTLPQTDAEFQIFGQVGYMPVGSTLRKQTIVGNDAILVMKEARKHATVNPLNPEDIH